ncbi:MULTISPECIES: beta-ketoacyl-ACP synthase [Pseudoalteromonas]|uniref:3-oxoacyl-[acyl-carrier-protein] synthase II n=1 Tax=Pseudoalteromonas nigrifaciens TaxID=28109 RepID=A0AAC9UM99_9GAMM|nr:MULTISPECIES: beta-ketoacyl-ACP synthase [Pseudoalteromonas]ASM56127.1 3-oxoacyl-[acyl-carrier-protein] synthase II [Pseudoalteromonas nigrifaciens]MBB1372009.1 beta-ketoacyl-ACP synthase [Pseudoalteromonas sp. SR45-4]GEN42174.1 beta-ketoacyl-ACP synthase II [Pseudoalteromonas nigrifaciens]SUD23541.1 3-oxoacyl-[acyl-carrier-protein] synthase 2 [Pseudoalteromonas nigrifaciens]|tara:strand:+ start:19827 stop:21056 length:1230 start_codon:yes stop_codon:yes gene_type:complete
MKRVVVTGMSVITALGDEWSVFKQALIRGENAVTTMAQWDKAPELNTRLAAPVTHFERPSHYKRKQIRSMGRVALMSTRATECALEQAQLLNHSSLTDGSTGISYGSSIGSTPPLLAFANMMESGSMSGVTATSYIQMMAHTAPVNVGVFFGLKGRVITTSSACTSGSQGIGYAYEAIKFGRQKVMVAGGAEELCITEAAVFDTLYATSTKNDTPTLTPRPFDKDRDGLVIGEGAGTLILEEYEHAKARGATILAEVVGFGCNSDGEHVTQPTSKTMQIAIEQALQDANLTAQQIGYVSAHGTSTDRGDIAESHATFNALGAKPISSLKSYLGHTLGACGAIEAWATINMMNDNWFAPTINLTEVDNDCAQLDYITEQGREINTDYVMSNNFAFGGINTSLIFKRYKTD